MKKELFHLSIVILLIFSCISLTMMYGCGEKTKLKPTAVIKVSKDTVKVEQSVTFNGADSSDADGSIVSYEWDFGNGDTATGETVTYAYTGRSGEQMVNLKVTDNDGLSGTCNVCVNVLLDVSIKIVVTKSTWREEPPYDIYNTIKGKLTNAGFDIVSPESGDYDDVLLVDYKEEEMSGLYAVPGENHGTKITCTLTLKDKQYKTIYEQEIQAETASQVYVDMDNAKDVLYINAISNFENEYDIKNLGETIASKV